MRDRSSSSSVPHDMRGLLRHPSIARSAITSLLAGLGFGSPAPAQGRGSTGDRGAIDPYLAYERLLRAAVRRDGVDYAIVRERLGELRAFCEWLAENGPTATPGAFASSDARLAYWLNAYNATVLRAIAEAPPTMRNVLAWQPQSGFFRARTHRVDRRSLTLDHIEHREIRERFGDPRVHAALNCGARSCPPLAAEAFRPRSVQVQLDRVSSAWIHDGAVSIDGATNTLRASMLFQWFADDFSRSPAAGGVRGPFRFVLRFANPSLRARLETACGADLSRCRVEYVPYDWSLNQAGAGP